MSKDLGYDVVYRGETRDYISPGRWVFFQRAKAYGGGYWLGQAYDDCFVMGIERPVSLGEGIDFLLFAGEAKKDFMTFDDDFKLEG